eukprot:TRINITY_DN11982_c0_g5_i1.p1 TRINITY_DN11982_c0_g5~~TRINITY_DN11982_c0_g5_i1.p1  ORF type:complete len:507 (+),score=121.66 TRINITY_DN11982_c0_g5_i1:104-1624(+)
MSTSLNEYGAAFERLAEQALDGQTSMEFQFSFWEKLYKLQTSYAKSIDDLCNSRAAKLQKLFSPHSCEPNESFQTSWETTVAQLKTHAEHIRTAAQVIHDDACGPLFRYGHKQAPIQNNTVAMGRRILRDLKTADAKLVTDHRRYQGSLQAAEKATGPHYERAVAAVAKDEAAYKQSQANYEQLHRQSFQTALPGVLKDMDEQEVNRVQTCTKASVTALKHLYNKDQELLPAIDSMSNITASSVSLKITVPEPSVPELALGSISAAPDKQPASAPDAFNGEETTDEDEVTKTGKSAATKSSGGGFFTSLFGGSKSRSEPKGAFADAQASNIEAEAAREDALRKNSVASEAELQTEPVDSNDVAADDESASGEAEQDSEQAEKEAPTDSKPHADAGHAITSVDSSAQELQVQSSSSPAADSAKSYEHEQSAKATGPATAELEGVAVEGNEPDQVVDDINKDVVSHVDGAGIAQSEATVADHEADEDDVTNDAAHGADDGESSDDETW